MNNSLYSFEEEKEEEDLCHWMLGESPEMDLQSKGYSCRIIVQGEEKQERTRSALSLD